jgi:hypothetical protein
MWQTVTAVRINNLLRTHSEISPITGFASYAKNYIFILTFALTEIRLPTFPLLGRGPAGCYQLRCGDPFLELYLQDFEELGIIELHLLS